MSRSKVKQDTYDRTIKRRYNKAKARARRIKRAFTISFKDYAALILRDECSYCGSELEKTGSSLDRLNNARGYTKKNSVACCRKCNVMKSNLTLEDFFKHIKRILDYVKF